MTPIAAAAPAGEDGEAERRKEHLETAFRNPGGCMYDGSMSNYLYYVIP